VKLYFFFSIQLLRLLCFFHPLHLVSLSHQFGTGSVFLQWTTLIILLSEAMLQRNVALLLPRYFLNMFLCLYLSLILSDCIDKEMLPKIPLSVGTRHIFPVVPPTPTTTVKYQDSALGKSQRSFLLKKTHKKKSPKQKKRQKSIPFSPPKIPKPKKP